MSKQPESSQREVERGGSTIKSQRVGASKDRRKRKLSENKHSQLTAEFYKLYSPDVLARIALDKTKSREMQEWRRKIMNKQEQTKHEVTKKKLQNAVKKEAKNMDIDHILSIYSNPENAKTHLAKLIYQKLINNQLIEKESQRREVWLLCSHSKYLMKQVHPNYYQDLKNYTSYPDYFINAIDLDLRRTYPKGKNPESLTEKMRVLLRTVSRRNPFIGYCQGLNFIASIIVEMKFADEIVKLIWDYLFTKGSSVLFKVGLVILDYSFKDLMKTKEFSEAILIIEETAKRITDALKFNKDLNKIYISKKTLEIARELQIEKLREDRKKQQVYQKKRLKNINFENVACNVVWPICHLILEKSRIHKQDLQFFVFRGAKELNIVPEYFTMDGVLQHKHDMSQERRDLLVADEDEQHERRRREIQDDLIIGRHHHHCNTAAYRETIKQKKEEFCEMQEYSVKEIAYIEQDESQAAGTASTRAKKQTLDDKLPQQQNHITDSVSTSKFTPINEQLATMQRYSEQQELKRTQIMALEQDAQNNSLYQQEQEHEQEPYVLKERPHSKSDSGKYNPQYQTNKQIVAQDKNSQFNNNDSEQKQVSASGAASALCDDSQDGHNNNADDQSIQDASIEILRTMSKSSTDGFGLNNAQVRMRLQQSDTLRFFGELMQKNQMLADMLSSGSEPDANCDLSQQSEYDAEGLDQEPEQ